MKPRIEPSTEIAHRTDFSLLCNARGIVRAVEIGVDLGVNARDFLSRWNGHWLILVDPYEPYPEIPGTDRTVDMLTALQALASFHGRFRFFRARSLDVASNWPAWIGPPGFVYLDGSHEFADVAADLEAWWAILEPSGILAGHDFDERHPEVMRAVLEFAQRHGLIVRTTCETAESEARSWYAYKTEPAQLVHRFFNGSDPVPNPHAS